MTGMDLFSPLPLVVCVVLALAMARSVGLLSADVSDAGRYAAIDGLRGYLALFVFVHHAAIWYVYLHQGRWETPVSRLYAHLGQGSVALFFMITAFLFVSKLIDGRTKPIDWTRLYVSRILRLTPLYAFAMVAMFVLIAVLAHGHLAQPIPDLVSAMTRWIGFTIFGAPDINGFAQTKLLVAGVTWSLAYEWYFYLSLPLLGFVILARPPRVLLVASMACVVLLASRMHELRLFAPFLGGTGAAWLVRSHELRRFARTQLASLIGVAAIACSVIVSPTAYALAPLALLSVAFALIAAGNTLFGVLALRVSHTLGKASYSLYLLHGLLLFGVLHFVVGFDAARHTSPIAYWFIIFALTPVLVGCCFATYFVIERPAMTSTDRVLAWTRAYRRSWVEAMRSPVRR